MNAHCEGCPHRSLCPAVPPTLNQVGGRSDLMIIGEGPGREEVRVAKGFQGPSGQLLRQALVNAGFDGTVVASLSNATLCLPPKEGMSKAACDACRPRLLAEIEQVNPRVVLALGRWACQSLLGRQVKITTISGLPREWGGRWLVPSIHPASVLRHGNEMSALQTACDVTMRLVRGEAGGLDEPNEPEWWVIDTRAKRDSFCRQLGALPAGTVLGCDIETTGLNPRADGIVALGIAWAKNKVAVLPEEQIGQTWVKALLEHHGPRFAWHNGMFDVGFLRAKGINARIDEDTLLMHYCHNEQKGTHDLEQVSAHYLGARDYKDEVAAYKKGNWHDCPPEILHRYLARDCDYTRQLVEKLGALVRADEGLEHLYRGVLLPAADLLTDVSAAGVLFSPEEAERLRGELEPRRQEAIERVQRLAPGLNPASQPQVYELLYRTLRLRQPPAFERNTSAETLRAIAAGGVEQVAREVIDAILDFRDCSKALSNVKGLEKRADPSTGRVHSSFGLHTTVTGRLSSRDPNLQNVPADLRPLFQAPSGRLLLETDLDQAELRVLANLSRDEAFAAIYREGKSLHKEVAEAMFGPEYTPDQYRQAKVVNFGIAYGLGAESLYKKFSGPAVPREQRITLSEAKERIRAWAERFPQAWEWLQTQKAAVKPGHAVRSPTGRLRRFPHVTAANLVDCQNEACNAVIQATASDICLLTAIKMRRFAAERDARIINTVHDSLLFEIPDDRPVAGEIAHETARQFAAIGAALVGSRVPITAEFKLGQKWGQLEKETFQNDTH